METNTQQERAKRLEQQAREYLMQSNDPIFTNWIKAWNSGTRDSRSMQTEAEKPERSHLCRSRVYHRRQPPENSRLMR